MPHISNICITRAATYWVCKFDSSCIIRLPDLFPEFIIVLICYMAGIHISPYHIFVLFVLWLPHGTITSRRKWICFATGGFKKMFWLLVMMGMAAVLLYNVVELTKKYLSYPVSVKLSVDHKQQLTFPTVTICNMSPVKKSSLEASQNSASAKRRRKRSAGRQAFIRQWHFTLHDYILTTECPNAVMSSIIITIIIMHL